MGEYNALNAHKLIADTCIEMAAEVYDHLCLRSNKFYKDNPNMKEYIKKIAPTLRPAARQCLAEYMARPDVSEEEKAQIYEAIVLDKSIPDDEGVSSFDYNRMVQSNDPVTKHLLDTFIKNTRMN